MSVCACLKGQQSPSLSIIKVSSVGFALCVRPSFSLCGICSCNLILLWMLSTVQLMEITYVSFCPKRKMKDLVYVSGVPPALEAKSGKSQGSRI